MARHGATGKPRIPGEDASRAPGLAASVISGRGPWRWLHWALLVWLILAILYPGAVFDGQVFRSSDASNSDMFALVGDAALADGRYPLWNPYLFSGMPSFGSLAYVRFLYPPSILFNFLQNDLGFAPLTWMLGHLLFGGLGMAWLLSRWKLPTGAILLGVAVWLLFPKVVAWGVHGHGSKLGAAMYLPWIVGWSLRVMDGRSWFAVGMTGLLLGLQLLRGHVQITYYTLAATAWLCLLGAAYPLEPAWRAVAARIRWLRLGAVALGLGVGFLIGGIMLVPVHDYAAISIRGQDTEGGGGVGLDYATGWSLAPEETGTFVLPSAAGFGKATYMGRMPFNDYPNYFGFLVLILAAAGWAAGRRRWLMALGIMALVSVGVSFGNFGFGLYEFLYRWLPYFNKFRIPSMILVLVAFAVALAAPRGLVAWRDERSAGRRWWIVPGVCAALGALMLGGGVTGMAESGFVSGLQALAAAGGKQAAPILLDEAWALHRADLIRIGLILLAAAGAFVFAHGNSGFRRRGLVWVLVGLVGVDLMAVDRRITHPERSLLEIGRDASGQGRLVSAVRLAREPLSSADLSGPQAATLQAAVGHDRLWPLGSDGGRNTWMADRIRSLGGYHPAKLARYESIRRRLYSEEPAGRLASWLAGSVVSFDRRFETGELEFLGGLGLDLDPVPLNSAPPYFYRNRAALPRARLASAWLPVSSLPGGGDLEAFLDAVQQGEVAVGEGVHLAGDPGLQIPRGPVTGGEPGIVRFVEDGMNEVVLQVETDRPAVLVLADMAAPGWSVAVDGTERELLTADLVLRGVALEAGAHEVRFAYHDPSVRLGLGLSLAGLLLALGMMFGSRLRPRTMTPSDEGPIHDRP
ncbi:MAG: hypothetical protein ABIK96_17385 [bacterium]